MTVKSLKAKLLAMVLAVTVMTALFANVYVKAATDSKDGYTMSCYHWAQKGSNTPWSDSTYVSYP